MKKERKRLTNIYVEKVKEGKNMSKVYQALFFPVFGFPHLTFGAIYHNNKVTGTPGYMLQGIIPHILKKRLNSGDTIIVPEYLYKYTEACLKERGINVECIDCCDSEMFYKVGDYKIVPLYFYRHKDTYRIVCSDNRFLKREFVRYNLKNNRIPEYRIVKDNYEKLIFSTWRGFIPGWEGNIDYGDISLNWEVEPGVLDEYEIEYGFTKEGSPVNFFEVAKFSCAYGHNEFICVSCSHWGADFCVHKPQ
jgi:hypothetical protein